MIDQFFNLLKKTMFAFVFILFGFATAYSPMVYVDDNGSTQVANVEIAHAGGAIVFDPSDFPQDVKNAVEGTLRTIDSAQQFLKAFSLDSIAWAIAKQILSNMAASIVDWINSGFEGSPAFVQDLGGFLQEAADTAIGRYINDIGGLGSFVCSPFRLDVQFAVALTFDVERDGRTCTLTDIIDNFEGFIAGERSFADGGWEDWFELTREPDSTPYGAILTAQTEARAAIVNARGEQLDLLDFGEGFLSFEQCREIDTADGDEEECWITKPGRVISDALTFQLETGPLSLIEADEINEIVGALLTQLTQKAITGTAGLLGLSEGTSATYSGYSRGSFVADLADGRINNDGTRSGSNFTPEDYIDPGIEAANNIIAGSIQDQTIVLDEVDSYIRDLTAFVNNPRNDEEDVLIAELQLVQAEDIRDRLARGIADATPILNQYTALDLEYVDATPERRSDIRLEQGDLLQQFSLLSLVSTEEIDAYGAQWDILLARNVGPLNDPCDFTSPDFDPDICFGGIDNVRF